MKRSVSAEDVMSFAYYVRIHELLESLESFSSLDEAREYFPRGRNGVYFFYQEGERFSCGGEYHDRIVRVGAHLEEGNLERRLRTHYQDRGSSVFRDLIRDALSNTQRGWTRLSQARQDHRVTEYLEDNFWFKFIALRSAKLALSWEKKVIATIAPYSYWFATEDWLRERSSYSKVEASGLWNSQHVKAFEEEFSEKDLAAFERLVGGEAERQARITVRLG